MKTKFRRTRPCRVRSSVAERLRRVLGSGPGAVPLFTTRVSVVIFLLQRHAMIDRGVGDWDVDPMEISETDGYCEEEEARNFWCIDTPL